jgi:hypothetical protein
MMSSHASRAGYVIFWGCHEADLAAGINKAVKKKMELRVPIQPNVNSPDRRIAAAFIQGVEERGGCAKKAIQKNLDGVGKIGGSTPSVGLTLHHNKDNDEDSFTIVVDIE